MFAIAWEYLTGRAVATDPTDRSVAEWPPHPDRVFQSLVAAWGERGEDAAERIALAELAGLPPPEVAAPLEVEDDEPAGAVRCFVPKVFVPVNDTSSPIKGSGIKKKAATSMQGLAFGRDRQPRYFPSVHVGSAPCALVWPSANLPAETREALGRVCAGVTHIGHSSSLVRMWLTESPPPPAWIASGERERRDISLRVPDHQRLDGLTAVFANGGTAWQRPPLARWQGYRRADADEAACHQGHFDDRLLILRQVEGPRLHLPQALRLSEALHKTLIRGSDGWTPELVSGHDVAGAPTKRTHIALLPLAHVGREYADGHLLGLALALPRGLAWEEEDAIYRTVAAALDTERAVVRLTLGPLGVVSLVVEERPAPPYALRPGTWCRPKARWATVTPIVLDRLPPRGIKDSDAWAAGQITAACTRQGLPKPDEITILPVSPCLGSPHARAFPPLNSKGGIRRWHTHAALTFPVPITGPLVLGAGRFRGYGLCRPLAREEQS